MICVICKTDTKEETVNSISLLSLLGDQSLQIPAGSYHPSCFHQNHPKLSAKLLKKENRYSRLLTIDPLAMENGTSQTEKIEKPDHSYDKTDLAAVFDDDKTLSTSSAPSRLAAIGVPSID